MDDGAYSFAYSTKTPGAYAISATAAGGHMDGSPATVTASIAEAHAPLCEVTGAPLRLTTTAGAPCITLPCTATHTPHYFRPHLTQSLNTQCKKAGSESGTYKSCG